MTIKQSNVTNERSKHHCIFCRIIEGKKSQRSRIIIENEIFVAMLVSHPQTRGHFIVFQKKHVSNLGGMGDLQLGELFTTTVGWAEKFCKALGTSSYVLKLNNNVYLLETDPLHVGHTHMHVIPRYSLQDDLNTRPTIAREEYFESVINLLKRSKKRV